MRGSVEKKTFLSLMGDKVVERLGETTKRASEIEEAKIKSQYPGCNRIREIIKDEVFKKTVFERLDDFVEGQITDISIRTSDFGNQLNIVMNDGKEEFILNINEETSRARSFMKIIPNASPILPVKIRPWRNDKNKSEGVVLSQEGVKLEYYFSKDDPKGMPPPPEFASKVPYNEWTPKQKSEYKIYQIRRNEFLVDYLLNTVAPKFKNVDYSQLPESDDLEVEVKVESEYKPEPAKEPESDDLPF